MTNPSLQKSPSYQPTQAQLDKIDQLKQQGYDWDTQLSISYAGVVMRNNKDIWVFDLDGGIHHNPKSTKIKC